MTDVAGTMVQAQSSVVDMARKTADTFWKQQAELLGRMEAFSAGWFERRRVGVQSALEASEHMCQATSPQACLSEYQAWAAGAFERVMADGLACQREFGRFMAEIVPTALDAEQDIGARDTSRKRIRISDAA